MEFYKIYKSFITNGKIKKCNANKNYIKDFKNDDDKKINENNKSTTIIKTNLGAVFK